MAEETDSQTTTDQPQRLATTPCSPSVDEFLRDLYASNQNRVDGDAAACELFGANSPFRIVCKCGSTEISIIGEQGTDYGGETGYSAGSTVIKCHKCGAAMTAWQ